MAGSLADPRARLKRAEHHLEVLERDYGISEIRAGPHRLRPEMHNEGLEYRLHLVESVEPLAPAVPFIISECLFNLRAALDHLVYQLHVRKYRGSMPDDTERAARFPILNDDTVDRRGTKDPAKWNEIRRLGKKERVAIRNLQPYIRRNDHLKGTRGRLGALELLNNIDKHRRLHVAREIAVPVSHAQHFPPDCGFREQVFYRPLIAGAEVGCWTFTQMPTKMPVHSDCWSRVAIDAPECGLRFFIPQLLYELVGDVHVVLSRFNRTFGDERWW